MFYSDENLNDKNQKEFNSEKQLVIVVHLEIFQGAIGLLIGLVLGFIFNIDIPFFGIIIFTVFLILMVVSFIQPALLRIIFFFMGLIGGLMIYYLLNIIKFIPVVP